MMGAASTPFSIRFHSHRDGGVWNVKCLFLNLLLYHFHTPYPCLRGYVLDAFLLVVVSTYKTSAYPSFTQDPLWDMGVEGGEGVEGVAGDRLTSNTASPGAKAADLYSTNLYSTIGDSRMNYPLHG